MTSGHSRRGNRSDGPDRVFVVVPAHNEIDALPDCLRSVEVAAQNVDVVVETVVVLDDCTDGTAGCVPAGVEAISVSGRSVGHARRVGFEHCRWDDRTWFATTDADSMVPPNWLSAQVSCAAQGRDVFVGTVAVDDWKGWAPEVVERYRSSYRSADGHRHVHGANLGMWASVYVGVGGFSVVDRDEDVDLVARLRLAGVSISWNGGAPVQTSARETGRATGGFADYLKSLDVAGEAS